MSSAVQEADINEPSKAFKRINSKGPAPKSKAPQDSALPGVGPDYAGTGSPLSDDSASTAPTRRAFAPMPSCRPTCHHDVDYQDEEEAGKAKKHGGPCYICWETG